MANNVVITKKARKKLVLARAGKAALPSIAGMAFGSGGVDESGDIIAPGEDQEELLSELCRREIDSYSVLENEPATVRYECTLQKDELVNEDISEIGLYDSEGDMVCIKNFRKKGKDDDMEMTFTMDDVF